MKKTIRTKVFATVIAAVCAASAVTAVSVASASAVSNSTSQSRTSNSYIIIGKTYDNTFTLPIAGEDWTYFADTLNVKVTCDYDYKNSICNFKFTAVKSGITNVVLKTQRTDGKWNNTPIRITTDDNLLMMIVQTGDAYVTEKSYTETPVNNNKDSSKTSESTNTSSQSSTSQNAKTIVKDAENPFRLPIKGSDWTYTADSLNVKISCDFDYNKNICNFKFTAVKPGVTNAILKTERNDGKWTNTPISITADSNLKITVVQTANAYVTNTNRG